MTTLILFISIEVCFVRLYWHYKFYFPVPMPNLLFFFLIIHTEIVFWNSFFNNSLKLQVLIFLNICKILDIYRLPWLILFVLSIKKMFFFPLKITLCCKNKLVVQRNRRLTINHFFNQFLQMSGFHISHTYTYEM